MSPGRAGEVGQGGGGLDTLFKPLPPDSNLDLDGCLVVRLWIQIEGSNLNESSFHSEHLSETTRRDQDKVL